MIRPMASNVSALASVVANGHQAIHFFSSTPSDHAVRRVFHYGWKSASSLRALPQPVPAAFAAEPTFLAVSSSGSRCIGSRLCPPAQPSIAKAGLAPASMSKVEGGTEEFPFCPRAGLSAARVKHDHLTTHLFSIRFRL